MERVFGEGEIRVNSMHHMAMDEVASGFMVTARCPDGVVEAIESTMEDWFAIGTQFHPESDSASALDSEDFRRIRPRSDGPQRFDADGGLNWAASRSFLPGRTIAIDCPVGHGCPAGKDYCELRPPRQDVCRIFHPIVVHGSFPAVKDLLGRGPSSWAGGHGGSQPEPFRARITGMDVRRIARAARPSLPCRPSRIPLPSFYHSP